MHTTETGRLDSDKDFPLHSDNSNPTGIWSDGTTIWVADTGETTLFAYKLSDGSRSSSEDIDLDSSNSSPIDIWSDNTTIWVLNLLDAKIFAYKLSGGGRDSSKDIDVSSASTLPTGIWSDGKTLWVADGGSHPLVAWDLDKGDRVSARDFLLAERTGLAQKGAVWAYGRTLWITSPDQFKAFAFNVPNDDTSLSELTVSPRDIIGFTSGRYRYAVGMASTVTTATLSAVATDDDARVDYNPADADAETEGYQVTLSPGSNNVTITVTAEDGVSTQRYTLTIARGTTDIYGWKAVNDLDGLIAADNLFPVGLWSDGTSFYVADDLTQHIYVYNQDGTRDSSKEIALDTDAYHFNVGGIWSDGTTMWVVDYADHNPRMFAYALSDGSRDTSKEFLLDLANSAASDILSDGTTMWVLDTLEKKVFAYRLSDGLREASRDLDISESVLPSSFWSDGTTVWIGDLATFDLSAWDLASGNRSPDLDFQIPIETFVFNDTALWSDDNTLWIADGNQSKVFSFNMPPKTEVAFSASDYSVIEGNGVSVTVTLTTDPKREVTIPIVVTAVSASSDDYSGVPESLVFSDGETTKSFVFSATSDMLDEDSESVQLTFGTAPHRVSPKGQTSSTVTILDDDRAVVLTPSTLEVDEGDATGVTYTVQLATQPSETVTVTVTGHSGTDVTLDKTTLSFTTTTWDTPQTVTVKASDDADGADDAVTLTHTAAGGEYADVTATLAVTVVDDDRAIVLTPSTLEVDEGEATGQSYTVKLSTQPSEQVTVTVTGHSGTDLTLDKTTLTFTTTTWNNAQTVTVKASGDADGTDEAVTLTHTAAGGEYAGATATLAVTVVDDDRAIVLTPSTLEVDEGDATGETYTVKLATQPSQSVTVTVSGQAGTDLTLTGLSSTSTLTFTTTTWNNAPDGDGEGGAGRRRGRRLGDPHPHRRRGELRRRDGGSGRHDRRRRDGVGGPQQDGPLRHRGGRHRRDLHGEALPPAVGAGHGDGERPGRHGADAGQDHPDLHHHHLEQRPDRHGQGHRRRRRSG